LKKFVKLTHIYIRVTFYAVVGWGLWSP